MVNLPNMNGGREVLLVFFFLLFTVLVLTRTSSSSSSPSTILTKRALPQEKARKTLDIPMQHLSHNANGMTYDAREFRRESERMKSPKPKLLIKRQDEDDEGQKKIEENRAADKEKPTDEKRKAAVTVDRRTGDENELSSISNNSNINKGENESSTATSPPSISTDATDEDVKNLEINPNVRELMRKLPYVQPISSTANCSEPSRSLNYPPFNGTFWQSLPSFARITAVRQRIQHLIFAGSRAKSFGAKEIMDQIIGNATELVTHILAKQPRDKSVMFPLGSQFTQFVECIISWQKSRNLQTILAAKTMQFCSRNWFPHVERWNSELMNLIKNHSLPQVDPTYRPKHFMDLGVRDYPGDLVFFEQHYPRLMTEQMSVDVWEVNFEKYAPTFKPFYKHKVSNVSDSIRKSKKKSSSSSVDVSDNSEKSAQNRGAEFRFWSAAAWTHGHGLLVTANHEMMQPGVDASCVTQAASHKNKKPPPCVCFPSVDLNYLILQDERFRDPEGKITMKMDIEGGEWILLEQFIRSGVIPHRIQELFLECHNTPTPLWSPTPPDTLFNEELFISMSHIRWECIMLIDVLRSLGVTAYPWP